MKTRKRKDPRLPRRKKMASRSLPVVRGYYHRQGYHIEVDGSRVHHAGNNRQSSDEADNLPPGDSGALTLDVIKQYCIITGKDVAGEVGGEWDGAERIKDGVND